MKIETKLRNEFLFEVRDAETGELKQTVKSHNIILNRFFSNIFETPGSSRYLKNGIYGFEIGRGTGTLDPSRTSLFSKIADIKLVPSTQNVKTGHTRDYAYISFSGVISSSQYNGETISEVGVRMQQFYGSGSPILVTHSLLKDMNGNPISIVKTDTDVITITGTIYVYYDKDELESQGIFDTRGDGLRRLFASRTVTNSSGEYYSISDGIGLYPVPTVSSMTAVVNQISTPPIKIDVTNRMQPHANHRGITYFTGPYLTYIPVDDYKVLNSTLGTGDSIQTTFSPKIGTFKNPKVYIDGVQTTDFEIIGQEMNPIDWLMVTNSENYPLYANPTISNSAYHSSKIRIFRKVKNDIDISKLREFSFASTSGHYVIRVEVFKNGLSEIIYQQNTNPHSIYTWGITIPEDFRNFDYLEVESNISSDTVRIYEYKVTDSDYGIQFNTPPPSGTVVTMDFDTPRIPLSGDNVVDVRFKLLSVNEYSG